MKKSKGITLIAKERQRQIEKGKTPESDMKINANCQLADVASSLADPDGLNIMFSPDGWSDEDYLNLMYKPYRERLIIAGALIAAELDRLEVTDED